MLLLDAGDALNGEEGLGLATKGKLMVEAMNLLGYQAMALGSGDFVIGLDTLRIRMKAAQFPMLSANAVFSDTGQLVGQPYVIDDLGQGHKAAIIGLTDPDVLGFLEAMNEPAVRVLDATETVRRYVQEVSGQADIIIVLSHMGLDFDQEVAKAVPGIDVIIGGKSGAVLNPANRVSPTGPVIAQAGSQGKYLGVLRLKFDGQGNLLGVEGGPVSLGSDIPDDPAMADLIERYSKQLGPTPRPVAE